jgi:hypothetical protein
MRWLPAVRLFALPGIDLSATLRARPVALSPPTFPRAAQLISDRWNHAVRHVSGSTGVITQLFGNSADINEPTGVAAAPNGSVYFASRRTYRLSHWHPAAISSVTTIAGLPVDAMGVDLPSDAVVLSSPVSMAVHPVDGSIVLADQMAQVRCGRWVGPMATALPSQWGTEALRPLLHLLSLSRPCDRWCDGWTPTRA